MGQVIGITPIRFDGRWSMKPPSQPGSSELPFRVVPASVPDVAGAWRSGRIAGCGKRELVSLSRS
jgi:hypothetical protein